MKKSLILILFLLSNNINAQAWGTLGWGNLGAGSGSGSFTPSTYCSGGMGALGVFNSSVGNSVSLACSSNVQVFPPIGSGEGATVDFAGDPEATAVDAEWWIFWVASSTLEGGYGPNFIQLSSGVDGADSVFTPTAEHPWSITINNPPAVRAIYRLVVRVTPGGWYFKDFYAPTLTVSSLDDLGNAGPEYEPGNPPTYATETPAMVFRSGETLGALAIMAGSGTAQGIFGVATNLSDNSPALDLGSAGLAPGMRFTRDNSILFNSPSITLSGSLLASPPTLNINGAPITSGTGAPTGGCTTGGLYLRLDGELGSTLYVCESSTWIAK